MVADSDSFDVPQNVRDAAKRGLALRQKYGRGGLDTRQAAEAGVGSGVQRASDLIEGRVTYKTIKRMVAFFARHKQHKDSRTPNGEPGAGMIAWLIWGGDPGAAWAKRIVEQEEGVKKGSLSYLALFGAEYPEHTPDSTAPEPLERATPAPAPAPAPAFSFSDIVKQSKKKLIAVGEDRVALADLVEIKAEDEVQFENSSSPASPPADAVAPELDPLSPKQIEQVVSATTDEELASLDKSQKAPDPEEVPTDPPPPAPPAQLPNDPTPLPRKRHVTLSKAQYAAIRAKARAALRLPLSKNAHTIATHILNGKMSSINSNELLHCLSNGGNDALACGGAVMLHALFERAVPAKYLEGLSPEQRAKRKKFIENRNAGKHQEGDSQYDPFPGDKDAKTKPSKYSKTKIAEQVRAEMDDSSKSSFLAAASKVSGVSRSILEKVYDRGSQAWASGGHRPGASQEAWARARVYSFLSNGKTRRTADKDLWEEHLSNK